MMNRIHMDERKVLFELRDGICIGRKKETATTERDGAKGTGERNELESQFDFNAVEDVWGQMPQANCVEKVFHSILGVRALISVWNTNK